MSAPSTRVEELAANLEAVHGRIAAACDESGRSAQEVTVVAITKTRPAEDVRILASLGIEHVGENRDQEASAKCAAIAHRDLLTVHFVGQLQTNKAAAVARYADVVQSVDRERLIGGLSRGADEAGGNAI